MMSRVRSRSRLPVLAVASTIAAITACTTSGYPGPNGLGVLPPRPPSPLWLGAIRPGATPAMHGAAAVTTTPTPNYSHVLVSISGGTPGRSYEWTLHSGSCGSTGAAIPVNGYPLTVYPDGTAKAEGYVPQKLTPGTPYSLVIAAAGPAADAATDAATDAAAPPACADLAFGSM